MRNFRIMKHILRSFCIEIAKMKRNFVKSCLSLLAALCVVPAFAATEVSIEWQTEIDSWFISYEVLENGKEKEYDITPVLSGVDAGDQVTLSLSVERNVSIGNGKYFIESIPVSGNVVTLTQAGDYTITASLKGGDAGKYIIKETEDVYTISIRPFLINKEVLADKGVILPVLQEDLVYNGKEQNLLKSGIKYASTADPNYSGGSIDYTYPTAHGYQDLYTKNSNGEPVATSNGNYGIDFVFTTKDYNYRTSSSGTHLGYVEIKDRPIKLKNTHFEVEYTGEDVRPVLSSKDFTNIVGNDEISVTFVYSGQYASPYLEGDNVTIKPNGYLGKDRPYAIEPGEYTTRFDGLTGKDIKNYVFDGEDADKTITFTIKAPAPKEVTIKWEDVSAGGNGFLVYDEKNKTPQYPKGTIVGLDPEDEGKYTLEYTFEATTNNDYTPKLVNNMPVNAGWYNVYAKLVGPDDSKYTKYTIAKGYEKQYYCIYTIVIDSESDRQKYGMELPKAVDGLVYNGKSQMLTDKGTLPSGLGGFYLISASKGESKLEPSDDNWAWGKIAGNYSLSYRYESDDHNYNSGASTNLCTVKIAKKKLTEKGVSLKYDYTGEDVLPTDVLPTDIYDGIISGDKLTFEFGSVNGDNVTSKRDGPNGSAKNHAIEPGEYEVYVSLKGDYASSYETESSSAKIKYEIVAPKIEYTEPKPLLELTYAGKEQTLIEAGESKNGTFTYSVVYGGVESDPINDASKVVGKNAGSYRVKYVFTPKYGEPVSGSKDVEIAKASLAVTTWNGSDYYYNGTVQHPTYLISPSGLLGDDKTSINPEDLGYVFSGANLTNGEPIEAGDYKVTAVLRGELSSNYDLTGKPTREFTIKSTDYELTEPTTSRIVYNGEKQPLFEAGSASVEGDWVYALSDFEKSTPTTVFKEIPTQSNAGTYTTYYKFEPSNSAYKPKYGSVKSNIEKYTVALKWEDLYFVYDGEEHVPTATVSGSVWDKITVSVKGAQSKVGTHTATAVLDEASAKNYVIANKYLETEFDIIGEVTFKKPQPLKNKFVYNGTYQKLFSAAELDQFDGTFTYYLSDGKTDGPVTDDITKIVAKDAGHYTLHTTFTPNGKTRAIDSPVVTPTDVDIFPLQVIVEWDKENWNASANLYEVEYNDQYQTKTVTIKSGVLEDDADRIKIDVDGGGRYAGPAVGVSVYTLTATLIGDDEGNYFIADDDVKRSLRINPARLKIIPGVIKDEKDLVLDGDELDLFETLPTVEEPEWVSWSKKPGIIKYIIDGKDSYNPTVTTTGDHTVQYYFLSADGNYMTTDDDPYPDPAITVTVKSGAKKTVKIEWSEDWLSYNTLAQSPGCRLVDFDPEDSYDLVDLDFTYEEIDVPLVDGKAVNAGEYYVHVSLKGDYADKYVIADGDEKYRFKIRCCDISSGDNAEKFGFEVPTYVKNRDESLEFNGEWQCLSTAGSDGGRGGYFSVGLSKMTTEKVEYRDDHLTYAKDVRNYVLRYSYYSLDPNFCTGAPTLLKTPDGETGGVSISAKTISLNEYNVGSLPYTGEDVYPDVRLLHLQDVIDGTDVDFEFGRPYGDNVTVTGQYASTEYHAIKPGNYTIGVSLTGEDRYNYELEKSEVAFSIVEVAIKYTLPKPVEEPLTYDGTEQNLIIPGVSEDGTFTYTIVYKGVESEPIDDASKVVGSDAGVYIVKYVFTPNNGTGPTEGELFDVIIAKADAKATLPTPKEGLKESDEAQELINVVEATEGVYQYSVDGGEYTTTVPSAIKAGTYKIAVKFIGDMNHNDKTFDDLITVVIEENASIAPVKPEFKEPTKVTPLTYNGEKQPLLNAGEVTTVPGTFKYRKSGETEFVTDIPTGVDAGKHTVEFIFVPDDQETYTTSDTVQYTVLIDKADPTVTLPTPKEELVENGTQLTLIDVVASTEGEYQYSVNGGEYTTTVPSAIKAGTYEIAVKFVGDMNHNDKTFDEKIVVVVEEDNTIPSELVFVEPTPKEGLEYTGSPLTLLNAGKVTKVPGVFKYRLVGSDDEEFSQVISKAVKAGGYEVEFIFVPNDQEAFKTSEPKSISVSIDKARPNVTLPKAKTGLVVSEGKEYPLLDVEPSSDGTFQYSMFESEYTTTIPSASEVGTYEIYVKFIGDANHKDSIFADPVKVIISELSQELDFDAPTPNIPLVYTGDVLPLLNPGKVNKVEGDFVYTIGKDGIFNSSIPSVIDAGTYNVGYQFVPKNTGIAPSKVDYFTIVVEKANPIVTLPTPIPGLKVSDEPVVLVEAGSCVGGTIQYSTNMKDYSEDLPTASRPGVYYVYVKIIGDENHVDKSYDEAIKVVVGSTSGGDFLVLSREGWTYGNEPSRFDGLEGDVKGKVTYTYYVDEDCTKPTAAANGAGAAGREPSKPGFYYLKADVYTTSDTPDTSLVTEFAIKKKELVLNWGKTTLEYDGSVRLPEVDVEGVVGVDEISLDIEGAQKNAGSYIAKVTGISGTDADYYTLPSNTEIPFTIVKIPSEVTVAPKAITGLEYNGKKQALITKGEAKGGRIKYFYKDEAYNDTIPAAREAKDYEIGFLILGDEDHADYAGELIPVSIAKKKVEVSWGNRDLPFTGEPQTPTVTLVAGSIFEGDDVQVVAEGAQTNAGKGYIATAVLTGADADNYVITSGTATKEFSITSNSIDFPVITQREYVWDDVEYTFVEENPNYTIKGDVKGTEPGKYFVTIIPVLGSTWPNGSGEAIEDTFVITRKKVEIPEPDPNPHVYNGGVLEYELPASPAYTVSGNRQIDVDTYPVTVSLKDTKHYVWSDNTTDDRIYTFVINNGVVEWPEVTTPLVYTYDGTEHSFGITAFPGSSVNDSNATSVNAGIYYRTVELDMAGNSGYSWPDNSTLPIKFQFVVKPQPVIIPEVEETEFIYTGEPFTFVIPEDTAVVPRYKILKVTDSEVGPGSYKDTLVLLDKQNYVWADGSIADRYITFNIGNGQIAKPNFDKEFVYTGGTIVFVPSNSSYTVEGGSGIEVGSYPVVVTPNEGFFWLDGSREPYKFTVRIVESFVEKPILRSTSFTYNGKTQNFRIPKSEYYTIEGDTAGLEPGKYKATLSLKPNYIWNDSTRADVVFNFDINKIVLKAPAADSTKYQYNGAVQTYKLVVDPICEITGNKQSNAGTHTVKISIDSLHYAWSDNTEGSKTFKFIIAPAPVELPVAVKAKFSYDGKEHSFDIVKNDNYIIDDANSSATEVGVYERTVSLVDPVNYVWSNGTSEPVVIKFEIGSLPIEIPTLVKEYKYTGKEIVFAESTEAYTVTNGAQTDAGVYTITIQLNSGYTWADGTTEDKIYEVEIKPIYVDKPNVFDATYDYDGEIHSFGFTPNDGYTFEGDTAAKAPGVYVVKVILNKNYIWDDETSDDLEFRFEISRVDVAIPVANNSKYIYNGEKQTYVINVPEDALFTVSNDVQVNAGKYEVKVALIDSIRYQWSDSTTADKYYDFVIEKARVALPTSPLTNFIYDGSEKELVVNPNPLYQVNDSNSFATDAGKYVRTAKLVDSDNYMWVDETIEPKGITFVIGDGTLEDLNVQTEYTYTGEDIVFVPEDGAYTVVNGTKKDVGSYTVIVAPNENYKWSDGSTDPKFFKVVIKPIVVEKPDLQLEYVFNKKVIDFHVPLNDAYEIIGETSAMEIGKYRVVLDLDKNYMWSDSTFGKAEYIFSINKKVIEIPPFDETIFVYNGKRQTYNIAKSSDYNVLGNVQAYAGSYEVSVLLTDFTHTVWSDGTSEVKTFIFNIDKAKVDLPKAVQDKFDYDGTTKYFNVVEDSRYEVLSKNASATEVGVYERTVTLKDVMNYTWIDDSVEDKTLTFVIGNGTVEIPVVEPVYVYNGKPIVFVAENSAYVVENGVKTDAGQYEVVVTLNDGYMWSDMTVEPKKYTVEIKPLVIEKPVFPETNVYTFDNATHGVVIPDADGYTVSGVTQAKEPGKYNVTVGLLPNYVWSDNTVDTLNYSFIINRIVVEIPAATDSVFKYTGSDVTYPIADTVDYYVVSGNHRTTAGLHHVTVSLRDSVHYIWSDNTVEPKIYEFLIGKYKVDFPVAVCDSFIYDGKFKLFEIVDNENYRVENVNGAAIEIGEYSRKVSLRDTINFLWPDGSTDPQYVNFYILRDEIPSLVAPKDLVYTGDSITLIPPHRAYTVVNNRVLNAGIYEVIVIPNVGFTWASDSSTFSKTFTVRVWPQMVEIPNASQSLYEYNGKPITYNIAESPLYTITGNVQTDVSDYEVVVELNDSLNYCWTDSTIDAKTYLFTIKDKDFQISKIGVDTSLILESIPGKFVTVDLTTIGGCAYSYKIVSETCEGLNVDTIVRLFEVGSHSIDVYIPDTVKPGLYEINVMLMSGKIMRCRTIEIKVNYPPTEIYVVWDDVIAVDNSSGLFTSYQWFKNGYEIPGETKQYLQDIYGLDGYYSCKVNDSLYVGPAFFHSEVPLHLSAVGGEGTIEVEVVGNIPNGAIVSVYDMSAKAIKSVPAEQFMSFDVPSGNIYVVKLEGLTHTVEGMEHEPQEVKVLVK